ncbi:hypothetical protein BZM27_51655 [Paraburkholderia steynii]|uniref:Uncharacterized protein n=1 Tax=Paraburkholderia steynii TaxID=1245441 RepID=A0A4R0WZ81_9BURK|nr:hypothetical protein BZM27_51655 [Paraburkholderia steynii]
MKPGSVPRKRKDLYVLDGQNRPVEVFDSSEWSRWMSENDLVFRRTLMEESGVTVTTRFRGASETCTGEALLFVTRVAGTQEGDNESYGARTLDEALDQHERIVHKILRKLSGR